MNVIISSRHFKLHPQTKKDMASTLSYLDQYEWKLNKCEVVLNSVHNRYHVEILIRGKGVNIEGKFEAKSLYKAFVESFERVTTQLKKCKDKQKKHQAVHMAMLDLIAAEMEEKNLDYGEQQLTA